MSAVPKVITVEVRTVYGNEMIYPACPAAEAFAAIAGTRTLPHPILKHIRALGYEIVLAPQVVKVLG